MTHSKIQKMKFFIFLFIFLLAQIVTCNEYLPEKMNSREIKGQQPLSSHLKNKTIQTDLLLVNHNSVSKNVSKNTAGPTTQLSNQSDEEHGPGLNSDALRRGFYVFLCLGLIVIVYIIFRTFRLNKTKKTQMIRKYGVLTHRQDVEMRPLPLDEDEDDDTTIFDARNKVVHELTDLQSSTA